MAAEVKIGVTADTKDAAKGLSDVDKALLALIESEKRLANQTAAKAKFDAMTEAEKDAFAASVKLQDGLEEVGNAANETGDSFKIAGLTATDMKSIFDLASNAAQVVYEKLEAVVSETVAYAEEVRDLGRISGTSSEETSKLIQTADDLKVSYDTLTQAAKALAKDGIALTTEELAKASDEYLAIEDAGARAEYATTKFGRAGLELTKVLETGGAALRAMAKDQAGGLILTQKQVDAARELEKAQDDLEDSFQALKMMLGNEVIPAITELVKFTTNYVFWADKTKTAVIEMSSSYPEYLRNIQEEIRLRNQSNILMGVLKSQMPGLAILLEQQTLKTLAITEAQYRQEKGLRDLSGAMKFAETSMKAVTDATSAQTPKLDDLYVALLNERDAYYDTGSAARVLTQAQRELNTAGLSLINESMRPLTTEMIYQKAAAGMDSAAALDLAKSMGLVNDNTYNTLKSIQQLKAEQQNGIITIEEYTQKIKDLANGQYMVTVRADFSDLERALNMAAQLNALGTANITGPTFSWSGTGGPGGTGGTSTTPTPAPVIPGVPGAPEFGGKLDEMPGNINIYTSASPYQVAQEIARIQRIQRLMQ